MLRIRMMGRAKEGPVLSGRALMNWSADSESDMIKKEPEQYRSQCDGGR